MNNLTKHSLETIESQVRQISEVALTDDESAHMMEDTLFQTVLKAIAGGCKDPQQLAQAALKSKDAAFHRWYA